MLSNFFSGKYKINREETEFKVPNLVVVLDWNTQIMLGGRVQIMKLVLYYCLTAVNVFLAVVKFLQSP